MLVHQIDPVVLLKDEVANTNGNSHPSEVELECATNRPQLIRGICVKLIVILVALVGISLQLH